MNRISATIWHNPALTVPAMVALLMITAAALVSKVVLARLNETQTEHFQALTGAYLDGLSTALKPYVLRRDPWEAFDVLDRARDRYAGLESRAVLVILIDETVLAASDPRAYPVFAPAPHASRAEKAVIDLGRATETVWIHRDLTDGGVKIGRIAAEIDVHRMQEERWQALLTLILFNAVLTGVFVVLGWLLVRRLMKPLTRLSDLLAHSTDGTLRPLTESELPPADTEVGQAYRRYNAAIAAIAEREALLQHMAEQERRALMGRFASAMAHEVNNPLGGMLNALRMIQRHGDDRTLRDGALTLLQRGLTGIQNVVRASLMTWRGDTDGQPLTPGDIDDIHFLIQSEANRRELSLSWTVDFDTTLAVPGHAVRQIVLNLLLNACAASQPGGQVRFLAKLEKSELHLLVEDQGPGMPAEARLTLLGTTREKIQVTGLGLWATSLLVAKLDGSIIVGGPPGSLISVTLPLAISAMREKAVA